MISSKDSSMFWVEHAAFHFRHGWTELLAIAKRSPIYQTIGRDISFDWTDERDRSVDCLHRVRFRVKRAASIDNIFSKYGSFSCDLEILCLTPRKFCLIIHT